MELYLYRPYGIRINQIVFISSKVFPTHRESEGDLDSRYTHRLGTYCTRLSYTKILPILIYSDLFSSTEFASFFAMTSPADPGDSPSTVDTSISEDFGDGDRCGCSRCSCSIPTTWTRPYLSDVLNIFSRICIPNIASSILESSMALCLLYRTKHSQKHISYHNSWWDAKQRRLPIRYSDPNTIAATRWIQ